MRVIPQIIFTFFLMIFSSNILDSQWHQNPERFEQIIDLEGKWKFNIGDKENWKRIDFNDNNWEVIDVPSSWEDEGFHGYDGYAWYRKTFTLDKADFKRQMYLIFGSIDDVDETYLNGKLIGFNGSFPPEYETAYNVPRKYPIPDSLLNGEGNNTLAVRVYDDRLSGGIMYGDVGIYAYKEGELIPDLSLEGLWKFRTGDSLAWNANNINTKEWSDVLVPAYWEDQRFPNYNGFAWYRKQFDLPDNLQNERLVLLMGKIDDMDEVYINGGLVGSSGNLKNAGSEFENNSYWDKFRYYYITNTELLKVKNNSIAVRVYDGFKDGGIYEGPIGLITQKRFREIQHKKEKEFSFSRFLKIIFGDD
jgi:sialate O-acetylesterase